MTKTQIITYENKQTDIIKTVKNHTNLKSSLTINC